MPSSTTGRKVTGFFSSITWQSHHSVRSQLSAQRGKNKSGRGRMGHKRANQGLAGGGPGGLGESRRGSETRGLKGSWRVSAGGLEGTFVADRAGAVDQVRAGRHAVVREGLAHTDQHHGFRLECIGRHPDGCPLHPYRAHDAC
eukprot:8863600-Pyramimonas_sp.AAC.1